MIDEGIIRVRYTNLYKFPIIDGNVVACLVRGTEVQILDVEAGFYKIKYGAQVAYAPKNSIKLEGEEYIP